MKSRDKQYAVARVRGMGTVVLVGVGLFVAGERAAWAQDQAGTSAAPANVKAKPKEGKSDIVVHPDGSDVSGAGDASRMDESYEAKGIAVGGFLFFPKLETSEAYNSNVFATNHNRKGDTFTQVSPQFRLQSRFANHALNVYGGVDEFIYGRYSSNNHTDGHVAVDGRLDISRETEATAFVDGYYRHEDRSSPEAVSGGASPTPSYGANSLFGLKHTSGKVTVSGQVGVDRMQFDDVQSSEGGKVSNEYRDRTETTLTQRAGYEFRPGYSAVMQLSENQRSYDNVDLQGISRDSKGYRVESGLGLDISEVIKGDILAGYMAQEFSNSTLSDVSGYSLNVSLNWTPTKMTLLVPAISRSVAETTNAGASSMVRTTASLLLRHELQRNLVVTAYGGASRDQYQGLGQSAVTYDQKLSATYAFVPEVYVKGELSEKTRLSDLVDNDLHQTIMMVSLGLRL